MFRAWLTFFLITTFGGFVLGGIAGGIVGGILAAAGLDVKTITVVTGGLGLLLSIPISYFTFAWVVRKFILAPPPGGAIQ